MNLSEYASYEALGLAGLIRAKSVTTTELMECALRANALVDAEININAVILTVSHWELQVNQPCAADPFFGARFLIGDLMPQAKSVIF